MRNSRLFKSKFPPQALSSSLNAWFSSQFADCKATPQTLGDIYSLSKSSFAVPANECFGTSRYDSLQQPGLVNAESALERKIRIIAKYVLSSRGEVFNVVNLPHHVIPIANTSVNSSSFLQVTRIVSSGRAGVEQRDIRLTLHLAFLKHDLPSVNSTRVVARLRRGWEWRAGCAVLGGLAIAPSDASARKFEWAGPLVDLHARS